MIALTLAHDCQIGPVRMFLDRYADPADLTPKEYVAWERGGHYTRCVQATLDPAGDNLLIGLLLFGVERRHLHLLYVCVAHDYRRLRLAKHMLGRLLLDPWTRHYHTISCRIRDNHDVGISWLKATGARAIAVLPGADGERDRYLFTYEVPKENPLEALVISDSADDSLCRGTGGFRAPRPDDPPGACQPCP